MANTYSPQSLGITAPSGGFQQGGWYSGRQYWGGTLSDPGSIHPSSNQVGAGQVVSAEVNAQSAAAQGVSSQQFNQYLQGQQQKSANVTPTANVTPNQNYGQPMATGQTGTTGVGTGSLGSTTPQAALNLPDLYKSLYASSGITDKETSLTTLQKQYLESKGKISDNPFLSASIVDKRLARLTAKYNEETLPLQNEIAMKKADIETQLNLETKQFDINSQVAQQALSQFNTLLSSGALDGASGEDIANITRSTGISSNMIQSAINANKAKNVKTSIIQSEADSGEVTISVINTETGEIIKQSSLGMIGNKQTGAKASEADKLTYYKDNLRTDASNGVTLQDIYKLYTGILDPNEILNLYNANSRYGPAKQSLKELSIYGVKDTTKTDPYSFLNQGQ